jgi:hypothetical protein
MKGAMGEVMILQLGQEAKHNISLIALQDIMG